MLVLVTGRKPLKKIPWSSINFLWVSFTHPPGSVISFGASINRADLVSPQNQEHEITGRDRDIDFHYTRVLLPPHIASSPVRGVSPGPDAWGSASGATSAAGPRVNLSPRRLWSRYLLYLTLFWLICSPSSRFTRGTSSRIVRGTASRVVRGTASRVVRGTASRVVCAQASASLCAACLQCASACAISSALSFSRQLHSAPRLPPALLSRQLGLELFDLSQGLLLSLGYGIPAAASALCFLADFFWLVATRVSENEDRQDIEGNLKVLIKKIPTLTIEGQGSLKMGDKDIANVNKFSCKFHGDFNLEKHPLPLEENDIGIDGCKSFTFGKDSKRPNRTIMFLGATGSGKSTLINGMINYILGIDWKDSFRFKLIDEGQLKSQAESQTSHVTAYKVNHQDGFKVPYSLTIVDTPSFGDTRGIERDRAITEQIRRLFTSAKGVLEIDAVCFVTQASLARLTTSQKYVFDSVLSIFGKDVAENICMLVTFADGQQPPVLEAINASKVPCPKTKKGLPVHFKFNNSALFADNRSVHDRVDEDPDEDMDVGDFDEMFWAMGAKSMKIFFTALDKMTTKSLQLTKEVLNERRQLEAAVEGVQPQVMAMLAKLEEIRSTRQQIEKHEADITSNENFEFEVEIIKPVQIMLTKKGEYITNCQQCSMTCHYPCAIADDDKSLAVLL
ncbi:hypothetical protein CRUP_014683 [Coryphaenoides rupestris]|nr:hypothetical protein CRUP_014683 [Coryphaenoides rupestris]